jgi:mono/diheme cytochrome c family protein
MISWPQAVVVPALLAMVVGSAAAQEDGSRGGSTLDGAFTAGQARRGADTYRRHCTACHVPAAVSGAAFRRAWAGRTVFDYFELLRTTMPLDNPGRLNRGQYADLVAYLLQLSGMPAGDRPLPSNDDALKAIRIEAAAAATDTSGVRP